MTEVHGATGSTFGKLGSFVKKAGQALGGGIAGADAVNMVNIPAASNASDVVEVIEKIGTGKAHLTRAIADAVNTVISTPNIPNQTQAGIALGTGAGVVAFSGARDIKKGNKVKGISKVAVGAVAGIEAYDIAHGKGLALTRGVTKLVGKAYDTAMAYSYLMDPDTIYWLTQIVNKATPALYASFCIYLLNKVGVFGSSSGHGGDSGHH